MTSREQPSIDSILLQLKAELKHGLNELAGHDPIEQAKAQIEKLLQSEALEELKGVQRVETVEVNYQYEDGSVVSLNQRIKQLETHLNMLTESTYPDNVLKSEGNVNISSKEKG